MFARLAATTAFATALLAASSASASLTHDYQLNGSLADAVAGGADIVNRAGVGSLGATGITFGADLGPTITGYSNTSVYSVETRFTFNNVNGYNNILDFKNGNDQTLYVLGGALNFFPVVTGPAGAFAAGQSAHLIFTRDGAGNARGYVNGVLQISFLDVSGRGIINNELRFFNDDGSENASGFVDYIRTYSTALDADQVGILARGGTLPNPDGVPEPATWALMILGFGGVGAMVRRRRAAALAI